MERKVEKKDIKFYLYIFLVLISLVLIVGYQFFIQSGETHDHKSVMIYIISMSIMVVLAVIISSFIYCSKKITEEKVFLYSIPLICLVFLLAMPIFKGHDEAVHWRKAFEVSTGKVLFSSEKTIDLPINIMKEVAGKWFYIDYETVLEKLIDIKLEDENKCTFSRVFASYSSIQYAPQAIGIVIARLFTDRILVMAYLGRILNCIVGLCICYKAIKIMPFGKKSILTLMYIPILIEGFTSLSGDTMIISISYLFIAYILRSIFEKENKLKNNEKVIIFTLAIVLAMCKMVYLPLIFLVLLLPKEKFKSNKECKSYKIGTIIVCIVITLLIFNLAMNMPGNREGNNAKVQLQKVISNPLNYIAILLGSMNQNGTWYIETLFGSHLSWSEDISLYFIVPYGLCTMAIMQAMLDNDIKEKLSKKQKYIILGIIVISVILIFSSMYITWTKTDSNIIEGVQGRYFLPLMPLVLILIGSIPIKSHINEEKVLKGIGIIGTLMQVYVIMSIVIRHI